MKKVFVFWLLIFFANGKAQNKFPMPGADWHYMTLNGLGSVYPTYNSNIEIRYTKDTIINGITAAVISSSSCFSEIDYSGINSNYFYSSNDSVFLYNPYTSNQWQLLYSFNTPIGQSWQFTIQPLYGGAHNTTWIVRVDSIDNIIINTDTLKRLFVTYADSAGLAQPYTSAIIERLGDINYLINIPDYGLHGLCDGCPFIRGILCYQDSTFSLYQPDTSKPCNYSTLDIKQMAVSEQVKVYPNPAQNSLQVAVSNGQIKELSLFDVLGNVVFEHIQPTPNPSKEGNSMTIDVSSLQEGVYFIQIKTAQGILSKKFIVQH